MTMIDHLLRQNWSTLHSLSITTAFRQSSDAHKSVKDEGSWTLWMERL
jgi:hypothetical protein